MTPNQLTYQNTYNYSLRGIPYAPNAIWVWARNWNASGCLQSITIT